MEQLSSIGRIFMKFDIWWVFLKNLWRKLKFHSNLKRIIGPLHEDLCTFLIISHWICHTMRNISKKCCRENQNTHFMFNKFFPPQKWCTFWDCAENYGRARQAIDDNIIQHMHFACWITKATDTHSEYVIQITFPWQEWFCEHTSMLYYTYRVCLVVSCHFMQEGSIFLHVICWLKLLSVCSCLVFFFSVLCVSHLSFSWFHSVFVCWWRVGGEQRVLSEGCWYIRNFRYEQGECSFVILLGVFCSNKNPLLWDQFP